MIEILMTIMKPSEFDYRLLCIYESNVNIMWLVFNY